MIICSHLSILQAMEHRHSILLDMLVHHLGIHPNMESSILLKDILLRVIHPKATHLKDTLHKVTQDHHLSSDILIYC